MRPRWPPMKMRKLLAWAREKLANALLWLYFKLGGDKDMAMIYATLICKGLKAFHEVPKVQMQKVADLLVDLDCEYLIDVDDYKPQEEVTE